MAILHGADRTVSARRRQTAVANDLQISVRDNARSLVRTVGTDAVRAFFCKIAHQRDACSSPRSQDRARSIRFGGAIYDFARASRHAAAGRPASVAPPADRPW